MNEHTLRWVTVATTLAWLAGCGDRVLFPPVDAALLDAAGGDAKPEGRATTDAGSATPDE
jgi:predicted small lipoprotein YifL